MGRVLQDLLEKIEERATASPRISIDDILDQIGRKSFGPILLLVGLVMLAPVVGDIPGVPVIFGFLMLLTAAQLLIRGEGHLWLPDWLLRRSVSSSKLKKTLSWVRKPAGFIDRLLGSRLTMLTGHLATSLIAVCCIVIALTTPVLEFIPFSANVAGIAVTSFGLALIAEDGVLALLAFGFTLGTYGLIGYYLF